VLDLLLAEVRDLEQGLRLLEILPRAVDLLHQTAAEVELPNLNILPLAHDLDLHHALRDLLLLLQQALELVPVLGREDVVLPLVVLPQDEGVPGDDSRLVIFHLAGFGDMFLVLLRVFLVVVQLLKGATLLRELVHLRQLLLARLRLHGHP